MMIFKPWKIAILCFAFVTFHVAAEQQPLEIEGFRVPEYDKNGVMTSQLFGDRAVMQDGGIVKITGAVMDYYNDGKTIVKIKSPDCLYDQKKSVAYSDDGTVEVEMEGAKVQGTGFSVKTDDKVLHIFNDSKVVITDSNDGVSQETTIISEELLFDYNGQVVRFVDDVSVDDSRMKLKCQKMRVKFDDNDDIERIDAVKDVQVVMVEADSETTVTSDKLFMNNETQKGHFEGNVHIADSQMDMDCNILDVDFGEGEQTVEIINASEEVKVVFANGDGETEIISDKLRMNYATQKGLFTGDVHVEDSKMNMDCDILAVDLGSGERKFERIAAKDGVRVVFESEDRLTDVTADKMNVDYNTHKGFFKGGVHVEDTQMVMDCETMNVRFDESNQVDWIEAFPDVKIINEGRMAVAGRAEYDMETDEILLRDDPKIYEGQDVIAGEQIRIWRETGRMVCEQSARLILYQENEGAPNFNFFGNE